MFFSPMAAGPLEKPGRPEMFFSPMAAGPKIIRPGSQHYLMDRKMTNHRWQVVPETEHCAIFECGFVLDLVGGSGVVGSFKATPRLKL